MKALLALALALILLAGCTERESGTPGNLTAAKAPDNSTPGAAQKPSANTTVVPASVKNTSDVMMANYTPPEMPHFDFINVTTPNGTLIVYYFHSSRCSACNALQPEIDRLEADYPDVLWLDYDIATQNGRYAYDDFAAQRNLSPEEEMVPQVLVNGTVITDRFHINDTLEGTILNYTHAGG